MLQCCHHVPLYNNVARMTGKRWNGKVWKKVVMSNQGNSPRVLTGMRKNMQTSWSGQPVIQLRFKPDGSSTHVQCYCYTKKLLFGIKWASVILMIDTVVQYDFCFIQTKYERHNTKLLRWVTGLQAQLSKQRGQKHSKRQVYNTEKTQPDTQCLKFK
jgi:hypothetical protein